MKNIIAIAQAKILIFKARVKIFVRLLKTRLALRWLREAGLTAFKVATLGETTYLIGRKGMYHKVGKESKETFSDMVKRNQNASH